MLSFSHSEHALHLVRHLPIMTQLLTIVLTIALCASAQALWEILPMFATHAITHVSLARQELIQTDALRVLLVLTGIHLVAAVLVIVVSLMLERKYAKPAILL